MLRDMGNIAFSGNIAISAVIRELSRRIPPGWSVERTPAEDSRVRLKLIAADGRSALVELSVRATLEPRSVPGLAGAQERRRGQPTQLVVVPFLSRGTRTRLREVGANYLDLTGNASIAIERPGLFIETSGADEDPNRTPRAARSLRGAKAGRVVRLLVDLQESPGVRELAALAGLDAGYVSRILALLDGEGLIQRGKRGKIESVDWPRLLRTWADESPIDARGVRHTYLDPRGIEATLRRLAQLDTEYLVTCEAAARAYAPTTSPPLLTIWTADAERLAEVLALRPAKAGMNVILVEPRDERVLAEFQLRDGVRFAAPSQVAADLLSSPGRGPNEADSLLSWMEAHPGDWRR